MRHNTPHHHADDIYPAHHQPPAPTYEIWPSWKVPVHAWSKECADAPALTHHAHQAKRATQSPTLSNPDKNPSSL